VVVVPVTIQNVTGFYVDFVCYRILKGNKSASQAGIGGQDYYECIYTYILIRSVFRVVLNTYMTDVPYFWKGSSAALTYMKWSMISPNVTRRHTSSISFISLSLTLKELLRLG